MSTTTTYPKQLVLPGQVAAPDGPVDMFMMYVMHHAFRRDLNKFAAAVAATPADEVETWRALDARWNLFTEVLHKHHSGEDAGIWPFLLERADAGERAILEAMEEEHSHIDPLLTACADGFATMAGDRVSIDAEDTRLALKVRVEATRDSLARHLAHEETDAIAILQRHMTHEDWERLEKEHFQERTPFKQLLAIVPWVVEDVPAMTRDEVFAKVGGPFKVIWVLARRSFRRQAQQAFAYVA